MITTKSVQKSLRPRFGSRISLDPGFAEGAAQLLRNGRSSRLPIPDLSRRMEDYLFNALYDRLGPGMNCPMDDGSFRRVSMTELPAAADEAMFPFFASLCPCALHYEQLHSYWMEAGSFSAMRALYLFFGDYLPAREAEIIERIVRENVPVSQQADWFESDSDRS